MIKQAMQALAPWVSSDWFIGAVVLLLTLWAGFYALKLRQGSSRLIAALERMSGAACAPENPRAFTNDYEAIRETLSQDTLLGRRWEDFANTLVMPSGQSELVRSTAHPDRWFNVNLMRMKVLGADLRFHAAMPNLLVGVGLLVTFIGLAAALSLAGGVMAEGAADRNGALRTLLETASAKFITSLWGLFLSVIYALYRKRRLNRVERAIDRFNAALEARIPLLTPVDVQRRTNHLLNDQLTALQAFSTDLAINMGQTFDRAFDARLGDHIGPLRESIEQLAHNISKDNAGALEQMLERFIGGLQGGASDKMQGVATSLEGLSSRLEGLQSGLGEAASRMSDSADAMSRRMGEGAEAALSGITNQMGGLAETLRRMADQTRDAGAEAGRELSERIERAAGTFETAASSVAETLAHAAMQLERRMGAQAEDSAGRLTAQVEGMVRELRELAEANRTAGSESMNIVAERVSGAAASFEATSGRIAEALNRAATETGGALGRGAEDAVQRIAAATEGMQTELSALIAEFRQSAEVAGDRLRDGGAAGADALRSALGGASENLAGAIGDAAIQLRTAATDAGTALVGGGMSAASALETAGTSFNGKADSLARQVAALASGSEAIVVRLADIDQAARDAASPLKTIAADLRAAGEAARGSVEPARGATADLRSAMDQFAGAVQRIDATHQAAGRLVEEFRKVPERFDGIDRSLGETVRQLQIGLQTFRDEVKSVTSSTDQHLGSAATHLQSLVQELSDTIEEFNDMRRPANGSASQPTSSGSRAV